MNSSPYLGLAAMAGALFVVVVIVTGYVMPYLNSVSAALSGVLAR